MGVVADILRFVGIFFGMKDSTRVFAESLQSAERYLRWAQERRDARDYIAALKYCENCNDDDAPKGEAVLRKYSLMLEIIIGLLHVKLLKYRSYHDRAVNSQQTLTSDIESVKKNIGHSRKVSEQMRQEGNMLKAADEESNIDDMERHLARLRTRLDNNPEVKPLMEHFRILKDEVMHYRLRLELAFASLQQLEGAPLEVKENLIGGSKNQMESIESELIGLNPANYFTIVPENQDSGSSSTPPPPPR